jgi:hypothetical protein
LSHPDLWQQLQTRFGINDLAHSWNLEPHIIILLFLLPLLLLFLLSCLMLGAGNTAEEPHGPRRKSESALVGEKETRISSPSASKGASGPSSGTNTGKGKKIQGSKKGRVRDDGKQTEWRFNPDQRCYPITSAHHTTIYPIICRAAGSIKFQNLLGSDGGVSSWSTLLGSAGFRGGETLGYKPIDIYGNGHWKYNNELRRADCRT